ncbi:MAG: hypothetical protein QNK18_19570 [Gammaproteobacteria bacterium]|nr:hypothetical protein [Gammaproteobacteria bacterium]
MRTWEFSQINEFPVQMEAYQGLFIASANLLDTMDAASLRRFDLTISFDYMRTNQAWLLFVQVMQERGYSGDAFSPESKQKIEVWLHSHPVISPRCCGGHSM